MAARIQYARTSDGINIGYFTTGEGRGEALTPDPSPAAAGEGQSVSPLKVRVGLNTGEPIAEDDDLFGAAVIVAARIVARAKGGEILVSDVVRQLVAGKGFLFNDRGEHALKGFEDPVRVWEVKLRRGEQ